MSCYCNSLGEGRANHLPQQNQGLVFTSPAWATWSQVIPADGVFTGLEHHTSLQSNETLQCNRSRSDTERDMLVKTSVPPFKTRMPQCNSPFICRFMQIWFAVKSHGSHKKSKSSSWSPSYDWSDNAQTGNTKQQAAKTNSIQKLRLSRPWINEMRIIV